MPNNQPVGVMQIVLTSNNASFSAGIAEAQRKLDAFAKTASGAGHSTVSSMQSASAAIRLLENPLGNNIRAIERLVSQSKILSGALKIAFPFVGAVAGGMILAKLGADVAKFIKTVEQMPKAIKQGFGALNLEQKTATDEMMLRNDELRNSIAKLLGKPQDNLRIALDEDTLAADKLAGSIVNANSKLNELLSKNHLSGFALLLGKPGTANREGTAKYFSDQADSNAFDLAGASTPAQIASAQKALRDTQAAQLAEARQDLAKRQGQVGQPGDPDDSANINIDKGVITTILNAQKQQQAQMENAKLDAQNKKLQAAKAQTDAEKQADQLRLKAFEASLNAEELLNNLSVKQVFDRWEREKEAFVAGSAAYNDIVDKQAELGRQGALKAQETIRRFQQQQRERAGYGTEGDEIVARAQSDFQRNAQKTGGEQNQEGIDSYQLSIVNAQNDAREREAKLTDEAGRSMTKYAAAVQMAQVHAQEFLTVMTSLQGILGIRQRAFEIDPSKENAKAVEQAQASISGANSQRNIQIQGDADNIYGRQTSAVVGASDALAEFAMTVRDTGTKIHSLFNNTITGFNDVVLKILTTPHSTGLQNRQELGNYGAGLFKSVAGLGLQKAEGSVLGLFTGPGSKKPTGSKGDPIYVQMATIDAYNAANAGAAGLIQGVAQAGSSTSEGGGTSLASLAGLALKALPMFAGGGAIGPDQWAIVGEEGPELFHSGGGGRITPNNKIRSGGGDTHYHIDATGSNDPAQVEAAVRRGISAATPGIQAGAVRAVHEGYRRRPSTMMR